MTVLTDEWTAPSTKNTLDATETCTTNLAKFFTPGYGCSCDTGFKVILLLVLIWCS